MTTPIEWLTEKLRIEFGFLFSNNILEQAKEIEKQQIELAFLTGKRNGIQICQYNSNHKEIKAEEYYNETFKK